ncbi:ethanolamine utilization protein [Nocardioides sp. GY 10127]|uniref:cupin domain-containing protein n=1 Tax=Nocardioides sp. GY 10127 TaxID=2569762 RepID=UPI0010A7818E|nr:ethanolamine utilization protein [Nocardioides sp. GY 10127]TIC79918.1 ethanolamine utilization protein [Nocardioides sp. GY 10127]
MSAEATAGTTTPFRVTPDAWQGLPRMEEHPDAEGYIGDVYQNPEGSTMCSGYFELHHTDEPLVYDYGYDEMKVVLQGEFTLVNVDTGQTMVAREKDAIFFPKGSRIAFSTPSYALAFYVGDRDGTLL